MVDSGNPMTDKLRDKLIGAWQLVSYVEKPLNGSLPNYPMGERPVGRNTHRMMEEEAKREKALNAPRSAGLINYEQAVEAEIVGTQSGASVCRSSGAC